MEPVVPGDGGLLRLRLDLGYDGAAFAGWARQPGLRTVQAALEEALRQVLRLPHAARVTAAGRTDAGVHARGQVAHVDVPVAAWAALAAGRHGSRRTPEEVAVRRLAGVLPPDLRVRRLAPAPAGFDARFAALWRRYAYRIGDAPWGVDPLRRHDVLWHRRELDVGAMDRAGSRLTGEHDFAAYCRPRPGASTVRTLRRLSCARSDEGLVVLTAVADAFCHSMVRALVGALLAVGERRREIDWPATVLARRVRDPGVTVVAAHGLTLEEVGYPPDEQLAARVRQTRQRRTAPRNPAAPASHQG